jgi:hypothetical protein
MKVTRKIQNFQEDSELTMRKTTKVNTFSQRQDEHSLWYKIFIQVGDVIKKK